MADICPIESINIDDIYTDIKSLNKSEIEKFIRGEVRPGDELFKKIFPRLIELEGKYYIEIGAEKIAAEKILGSKSIRAQVLKMKKQPSKIIKDVPKLEEVYTPQSFLDLKMVEEKRRNKDYIIKIAKFDDDGEDVWILIDGHHSLHAAKIDGVKPIIEIIKPTEKTLERYVTAFGDLSNPMNVMTGNDLW